MEKFTNSNNSTQEKDIAINAKAVSTDHVSNDNVNADSEKSANVNAGATPTEGVNVNGAGVAARPKRKSRKVTFLVVLAILFIVVGGAIALFAGLNGGVSSMGFKNGRLALYTTEEMSDGVNIAEDYDRFDAITINSSFSDIEIRSGETFSITGTLYGANEEDAVRVSDATNLNINTDKGNDIFFNLAPIDFGNRNKLIITYNPNALDGKALQRLTINSAHTVRLDGVSVAGETSINHVFVLDIKDFETRNLSIFNELDALKINNATIHGEGEIESNAGSIKLENITYGSLSVDSNVGEINVKNMYGHELDLSTDTGAINANGSMTGEVDVEINVGAAKFDLDINEQDIGYELQTEAGSVHINGENVHRETSFLRTGAKLTLTIESDIGDIRLAYKK